MKSWLKYLRAGFKRELPPDKVAKGGKSRGLRENLKNLKPFYRRHWRRGLIGGLLILVTSLLAFPTPLINRFLIDRVILGKKLSLLAGVVILLVALKLVSIGLGTWQQFYFTRFEQEVLLDIQQTLLDRTLRLPKSFFDSRETGYLMSRLLGDVQGLRWFFSSTLIHIFTSLLRFGGGIAFLVFLNWRLAIAVLIALPVMFLAVRFFSRRLHILSHHGMERQAEVYQSLQESLATTTLIKSFSTEEKTVQKVMGKFRALLQLGLEQNTLGSVANLAIGAAPDVAQLLVWIAGAYLIIRGDWTLGSLIAFQSYVGYVYGPAQFLASANFQLQNARAALERVSSLFDIVPEENLGKGLEIDHIAGRVEFREVSFSYDSRDPVLEKVSFLVQPGEQVAIVGPSGVGKTTLISLIMQFYRPQGGVILFDDRPAFEYELAALRRRIGYVAQSVQLLSGTIQENIVYGDETASEEEVFRAARIAGIHDFISGLEQGYRTLVGEKGINFSEGQKQRLSIARALVKDPDILILDEPTAALDTRTEKSLFESLPEVIVGKTLFLVAHRLSTIRQAQRILLLSEGKLLAIGSYGELAAGNAYFQELIANQSTLI